MEIIYSLLLLRTQASMFNPGEEYSHACTIWAMWIYTDSYPEVPIRLQL